ncbi:hypothetical protein Nmel_014742 [Mimus melanotis]
MLCSSSSALLLRTLLMMPKVQSIVDFRFGLLSLWFETLQEQTLSSGRMELALQPHRDPPLMHRPLWCPCPSPAQEQPLLTPPALIAGAAQAKGSSKLLSTFLWLCGMEHRQEGAEPKAEPLPMASLEEKPLVKHVLNINLLLCVCAGLFLWAYFA